MGCRLLTLELSCGKNVEVWERSTGANLQPGLHHWSGSKVSGVGGKMEGAATFGLTSAINEWGK